MKRTVSFLLTLLFIIAFCDSKLLAQSLYIPGGVNYVEAGDLDVAGTQMTIEAMVTMTGAGVNIVSKHTDQSNVNYLLRPGSAELTTTNGYVNAVTGFPLVQGECYHMAFTYNGSSLDYYINGCLASSTPHTGNIVQNDLITAIGNRSDCQCETWIGYIDEVRIWNVARTQAEIQANMNDLPNPTTQAGLLAYYKFDGNYLNLQGNAAFDGVPIGAPQLQADAACQNATLEFQSSAVTTDVTCNGDSDGTVTFTSLGGHPTYSYSVDGVNYFPNNPVTGLPAGTATVYARSGSNNGCVIPIQVTINEPPAITTSVTGSDVSCNGGTDGTADLTVNGGTGPYSYLWSNGNTSEDPTDLVAGNNTVTITDANGCTATESIVLNEPSPIFPNAFANYVSSAGACDGGGVSNPTGGQPPYTYSWSSGGTGQNETGLCEGPYTITVTDANGCTGSQVINVAVPACLTDVDFNSWLQAGQPGNGNWVIQNGGAQVRQTINGAPTFYITPVDYINVRMRGRMRTTDNDDDYMGVVFGFQSPLGASNDYDMWLFDWKEGNQNSGGYLGQEGMALSRVLGTIPSGNSTVAQTFFGHQNTADFTLVASQFGGGTGWTRNVDHLIEVTYTVNRAIILVDGDTIFDVYDCFEPGRFGFYNYSQREVIYSDFTYELFADFTVEDQQVCVGDTAHFTFLEQCGQANNLAQFAELQWNFGDGSTELVQNINLSNVNPTHIYQNGGTYTVELIALDTLGCRDTVFKDITVFDNPVADFTFVDQCFQNNTQFTDASTQGDFAITVWNWEFGDGGTDNQPAPTHQYANTGTFDARLVIEDSFGCTDTSEQTVEIYVLPVADFTPIDDCFSPNYPFEDLSTISSGTVDAWEWDFGDVSTSTTQNPTHTYGTFGTYDVQLVAISNNGCRDTISQQIILHDNPIADITIPSICQLEPMQFLDNSTIQEGAIVSWDYAFGDGGTSALQDPPYMYQDAGMMDVQLTVTSDFGCSGTVTIPSPVHPKPLSEFTAQNECLNDENEFLDQSSVVTGAAVSWDWDFGDSSTDNVQNTTHTYTTFGNYTIEQIVETDQGCRDTSSQTIEVYQLPIAEFSFSDVCLDNEATFTDQSSSNSGVVDTWNWDLGDNSTETGQGPVVHTYSAPDTYTVELIVETDLGCFDTIAHDIIIYPMPVADFIADSACFGQITSFNNLSIISSGTIDNYSWDFGNGATANVQNPTNIFPQTGYSPVFLTVTSDFGCKDTITKNIRVYVLPEPDFLFNDTCFEDNVSYQNLSIISEGTIDFYDWEFGDANNSTEENPVHLFGSEGFYQTELIATSNFGCLDSVTKTVEIYPLPQLAYLAHPEEGCMPLEVLFENQSTITSGYFISGYTWDFGHGLTSTEGHPQTVYPDSGYYDVMLTARTTNGCVDTLHVVDAINVFPTPIAGFDTEKDEYYMYFPSVAFLDESYGSTEWFWDFDDGSQSLDQNPVHEYLQDGTYQVIQTVYNNYGCLDEFSQRVIIKPAITFYIPNAFTPNSDGINESFAGQGEGIVEYQMDIYDRWGEHIFSSSDMDFKWDGSYKGKQVESGMYIYKFAIIDKENEYHEYTGEVFLMR